MSNSDFLSFFPEEDGTAALDSQELALLFDGINEKAENSGEQNKAGENQGFDDFDDMLSNIEMLEEMLVETDMAGETIIQEMTDLEEETSVMFEGDDLGLEPHQEEDLMPAVSLVPPFLQSYQTLQTQLANLTQRLVVTEQELTARQRRASSTENLIEQQAIALTQAQEQLVHTVAELQVHQEASKHQQLQVETLTEQLATSQEQVTLLQNQLQGEDSQGDLPSQIALLTEENQRLQSKVSRQEGEVARFEKQLGELRTRLQRQQRYALQYKSALEQYLAQPDSHAPSDINEVVASVTGQSTELQPWASVGDILAAFPANVPAQPASAPVADLTPGLTNLSVSSAEEAADQPESEFIAEKIAEKLVAQAEKVEESTMAVAPEPTVAPATAVSQKPLVPRHTIDTLSFAVREQKPSRRHIELPRFLPRSTPAAH